MFDAACGFGGYRESGYGREGAEKDCSNILNRHGSRVREAFRGTCVGGNGAVEVVNPSIDRT